MAEMTRDEVFEWLRSGVGWVRLATVDRDGYPHVVPLGYFMVDDEIVLSMRGQREANVRRNPKVGLCFDAGTQMSDLKGVVIRGDARLVEDHDELVELARAGARARGVSEDELPSEPPRGRTYIRVTPVKVASWDNAKR